MGHVCGLGLLGGVEHQVDSLERRGVNDTLIIKKNQSNLELKPRHK